MPSNYDLVNSAFGGIGRQGFGLNPDQIDQDGFGYWLDQLNSGALSPSNFGSEFTNSVNQSLTQNPYTAQSQYVKSFLSNENETNPTYKSELIRSLRESSPNAPFAPGVMLRQNKSNFAAPDFSSFGSGQLNNPGAATSGPAVASGTTTKPATTTQTPLINNPPKIETTVEDYLPYVVENVNDYLGSQTNEDLVKAAYESIGRTGPGTDTTGDPTQIDQEGWNYWTKELNEGNLTPAEFQQAFSNSVNTVLDQNPDAAVSQYVSDYLGGLTSDQLVREAYADIGRSGIGTTANTIDQKGYDYWTDLLDSGVSPEDFQKAFHDSVVTVLGYYPGEEKTAATKTTSPTTTSTTQEIIGGAP